MSTAALKDAYHSIKAALDIFKGSAAATTDVPSKQDLVQQAERVKAEAAKSECRTRMHGTCSCIACNYGSTVGSQLLQPLCLHALVAPHAQQHPCLFYYSALCA
jgi:hypothetical protein